MSVAIEDTDEHLAALRDLVASEGWRLLVAYVAQEWSAERLLTEIGSAAPDQRAARAADVIAERQAVTRVMRAPRQAIREMEERRQPREAAPVVPPRA